MSPLLELLDELVLVVRQNFHVLHLPQEQSKRLGERMKELRNPRAAEGCAISAPASEGAECAAPFSPEVVNDAVELLLAAGFDDSPERARLVEVVAALQNPPGSGVGSRLVGSAEEGDPAGRVNLHGVRMLHLRHLQELRASSPEAAPGSLGETALMRTLVDLHNGAIEAAPRRRGGDQS